MGYRGQVKSGVVVFENAGRLPEGTEVSIEVSSRLVEANPLDDPLCRTVELGGDAGVPALATDIDHYLSLDREGALTLTEPTVADSEVELPTKVLHPGTTANGTVVLDSGEILPEESIVAVEVVDGSMPGELGVVEAGRIKLDWPDAIPEGMKANVEVTGKLLRLDEIDPAFKIGDRAVRGGIPDLAENFDHDLQGGPR